MGLGTLLRAAAIIGACIWTIFLIRGWSAYSDMQAFRGGMYEKVISDAFQSLTIQTIVVFLLFLGGIFIKGFSASDSADKEESNSSLTPMNDGEQVFNGIKDINNDAYKIYLTKKYSIEKNEVLSNFICNEKLFSTIDEALAYASNEEGKKERSEKEKEEKKHALDEIKRQQNANEAKIREEELAAGAPMRRIILISVILVLALLASWFAYNNIQNRSDKDKLSSIEKNGIDGWGLAQEAQFKDGNALLLLNSNDKNNFRKISYYQCIPSQSYQKERNIVEACSGKEKYFTKITGDKVVPMAEVYKNLSQIEEADPNFKKANYEDKLNLKKQGWNFVRFYYEGNNKVNCSVNAFSYDYYNANEPNKIKKVTYCNSDKTEQVLDAFSAEQIYVKSGMFKGD